MAEKLQIKPYPHRPLRTILYFVHINQSGKLNRQHEGKDDAAIHTILVLDGVPRATICSDFPLNGDEVSIDMMLVSIRSPVSQLNSHLCRSVEMEAFLWSSSEQNCMQFTGYETSHPSIQNCENMSEAGDSQCFQCDMRSLLHTVISLAFALKENSKDFFCCATLIPPPPPPPHPQPHPFSVALRLNFPIILLLKGSTSHLQTNLWQPLLVQH